MAISLKHKSHQIHFIDNQADLNFCLPIIAKNETLAIDLEFDHNMFRYGFLLCLIQIATEKDCFLIDPFAVKNLEPLWQILRNPQQLKILHAANEDIKLLKTLGCSLKPIFDTELAARLLNFPRNSLQGVLADVLLVEIEKGQQKSDWGKRPLTSQQLFYAANDVIFLHKLHQKILAELNQKNLKWIFDQECEALTNKETDGDDKRLKDLYASCSDYEFFVISKLHQLREDTAKKLNKPPAQVFSNDVLWDLLKNTQETLLNWYQTKGLHPKTKTDEFIGILEDTIEVAQQEALEKGLNQERKFIAKPTPEQRKQVEQEKESIFFPIRNNLAEKYGEQAISIIMSKKLIEMLIEKNTTIAKLKPYQISLITETAQSLGIDISRYQH
jgi:ribonuclease D